MNYKIMREKYIFLTVPKTAQKGYFFPNNLRFYKKIEVANFFFRLRMYVVMTPLLHYT